MAFRLPKNLKGFFKKDGGGDSEPVYKNEDFGLEDDWDELEDRFQEKDDKIVMEEPEDDKKARRLKGKLIFGLAGIILVFLLFSVLSNALAPKNKEENKENAQFSKGSRITNPASDVPNNYAEMAKYQRELEARKAAEEALRKRNATEGKVVPPANVTPPNPPAAPSVPQQPAVQNSPTVLDDPNRSSITFPGYNGNEAIKNAAEINLAKIDPEKYLRLQKRKEMEMAASSYSSGQSSNVDMSSTFTLQAGTVIPATLLSGIDSRLTGDVVAQVRQDVYDSLTGRHLIFPQGSKLVGKLAKGKGRRVGVTFTRIILPDGSNVNLPEQSAVENAGYPGMKDKYDAHDPDFYRGAVISGIVGYLAAAVDEHFDRAKANNGSNNNNDAAETAMTKVANNVSNHIMKRVSQTEEQNVVIRPGYQFNVFINQDLSVYQYLRR